MRVLLLCGQGASSEIVFTHLKMNYELAGVVLESPPSKWKMLQRRIKRLGIIRVSLQLIFMTIAVPLIRMASKKRYHELRNSFPLQKWNEETNLLLVSSVNEASVLTFINENKPDVVVVNGTRIIKRIQLAGIKVPVINIHVGITPKYRGVHGGYWALVNKDAENCGVTVHYVDAGIDTGSVIAQKNIVVTPRDTFTTYPLLQLGAGLDCLDEALKKIGSADRSVLALKDSESVLYYHPEITKYLYHRIFHNVK